MSPWEVLGISSTDEARVIKKAYAQKLKLVRPDEKPREFQTLHQAYKWALSQAKTKNARANTAGRSPEKSGVIVKDMVPLQQTEELPLTQQTPVVMTEQSPTTGAVADEQKTAEQGPASAKQTLLEDEKNRVLAQVDEVLSRKHQLSNDSTWRFIAESPYLLDEEFNWELGIEILSKICNYNKNSRPSRRRRYTNRVGAPALQYLDSLFNWKDYAVNLRPYVSEEILAPILHALQSEHRAQTQLNSVRGGNLLLRENKRQYHTPKTTEVYFANLLIRSLALIMDCALLIAIAYVIVAFIYVPVTANQTLPTLAISIVSGIPAYFLMALILESSHWQATPFKRILGLRVVNKQGTKLSFWHNLGRIMCFALSLTGNKFTWIINCFLAGNLLHDRASRSYVIDTNKS